MYFARCLALREMRQMAQRASTRLADFVSKRLHTTWVTFLLCIGVYLGSLFPVLAGQLKSPDYFLHMDAQQAIPLELYRAFAREQLQFAHPLSVIRVAEPNDPAGGWLPHSLGRREGLRD